VNTIIKINEDIKPNFLVVGKNKRTVVNSSRIGSTQDTMFALVPINGERLNTAWKVVCSINLEVAV
jgi:hypothetical protein